MFECLNEGTCKLLETKTDRRMEVAQQDAKQHEKALGDLFIPISSPLLLP